MQRAHDHANVIGKDHSRSEEKTNVGVKAKITHDERENITPGFRGNITRGVREKSAQICGKRSSRAQNKKGKCTYSTECIALSASHMYHRGTRHIRNVFIVISSNSSIKIK